ncbi:zinc ribbon domain-containing protein [Chitinophaga lutea]|uniref:Zinc ribbon domain-containing protein n=1 Tax=Chitinophaga lutea TaxID=2488634 RepID=A0A3N4PKI4_9BACT|nr:DUF6320 domain-containing protein [Chitinophaga lutea]RPE09193.1 zinc ribbon domain-containing protein [Chitinophaga lutea]
MYCKNCGVELENDMLVCPLCGQPVDGSPAAAAAAADHELRVPKPGMTKKRRKFTWDIVSLILGSGMAAAGIVNYIISRSITWSEYTTAVGLVIFCYASVFAFFSIGIMAEMGLGFFLASLGLIVLDWFTGGVTWATRMAIPLLVSVNVVVMAFMRVERSARHKGVNLIAYAFVAAALLCLCVEGILSYFMWGYWRLNWSVIVAACVAPVALVLLFVHFRLRRGRNLERVFHI